VTRSIQILSVFFLLTLASVVRAQTPPTCGIVGIEGTSKVEQGIPLYFKVKTTGMLHTTKPEYKWTVSRGIILNGQGTYQLSVDTSGIGGIEVTATVELVGATPGCNGSASTTALVEPAVFTCGLAFDQFGDLKFRDEKARLDNFAIQLVNESRSSGYILMSAGQKTFQNEAKERLARAKSYIVNLLDINPDRVITVDCGFTRDLTIKLYIAPPGLIPPTCDLFMGIPRSEVKFTKPRPGAAKKRR
jgi:hypothetical protein